MRVYVAGSIPRKFQASLMMSFLPFFHSTHNFKSSQIITIKNVPYLIYLLYKSLHYLKEMAVVLPASIVKICSHFLTAAHLGSH